MKHLVDTSDLSLQDIAKIFDDARAFKAGNYSRLLLHKQIVTLFFEDSTRTRSSFEIAAKKLGADVIHLDPSRSSANKGETLLDTVANLSAMDIDGLIIRHSDDEAASKIADANLTPVINAGTGKKAHPSQALLDLFTISEFFDAKIEGKHVVIVGDIVSSRVASSQIALFERMGLKISLVAPKPFMPQNSKYPCFETLDEVIDSCDVIISLRAQLERHKERYFEDYSEYAKGYCITQERLRGKDILLMHPGPVMRNIDIDDETLNDSRCKVLEQVTNGLYVRMALLKHLLLDS